MLDPTNIRNCPRCDIEYTPTSRAGIYCKGCSLIRDEFLNPIKEIEVVRTIRVRAPSGIGGEAICISCHRKTTAHVDKICRECLVA